MPAGEKQLRQARFWRKFQLLTRGRIDVVRALEIAADEEREAVFAERLRHLGASLREGQPLSEALERAPAEFSRGVRALIRSAEQSGAWDEILPLVAQGLEDGTLE